MNRATKKESLNNLKRLGFVPKTIIDVGAQVGTPPLYEVFPNAHHILIEPIEENEKQLKSICSKLPNAAYMIAGATSTDSPITLKVSPNTRYAHKIGKDESVATGWITREVKGISLDTLCLQKELVSPYLIKIDVDGSEVDVLKGGVKHALKHAEYVILEATTNSGQRIFDIVNFMRKEGFHVYDIVDFMYRPAINDLWQVDVAFVKAENSKIPFKMVKQYAPLAENQPNGIKSTTNQNGVKIAEANLESKQEKVLTIETLKASEQVLSEKQLTGKEDSGDQALISFQQKAIHKLEEEVTALEKQQTDFAKAQLLKRHPIKEVVRDDQAVEQLKKELADIKNSYSLKIGLAVTNLFKPFYRLIKKR